MPISNEIFESYRIEERAKEQLKALRLLAKQGYTILDLEGNIINKHNIDDENKPKWWYKRVRGNK
tara:strand:+ start:226 stop:420 length:195 start_codon:yes stop_codon:yes gene_type:complete